MLVGLYVTCETCWFFVFPPKAPPMRRKQRISSEGKGQEDGPPAPSKPPVEPTVRARKPQPEAQDSHAKKHSAAKREDRKHK